mmetsp:Transcript_4819/g.8745  ORF Transcript_4819/g.8745 Transcript_4819/m.8745 type:complete len:266 (+) Transcript_4819:496-1293(+)
MELPILRIREREMVQLVGDVRHPGVQILIAASGHQFEMSRHAGHLETAFRVASSLKSLVVRCPSVGLHFYRTLEPPDDVRLVALALVDGEGAIGLVQPNCRVCIDALLVAELLEVNAVHPDETNSAIRAITVGERLRAAAVLAVDLRSDHVPRRREVPTVTAPLCKEVDHREVMSLNHVFETLVLEAVMRARPVRIELRLAILLDDFFHLTLMLNVPIRTSLIVVCWLVSHAKGSASGIYGPQPEIGGHQTQRLPAALPTLRVDN